MYTGTFDSVSDYIQNNVHSPPQQQTEQQDFAHDDSAQDTYESTASDIVTKYIPWSTDTNDIE